jgi:hypothetical protein
MARYTPQHEPGAEVHTSPVGAHTRATKAGPRARVAAHERTFHAHDVTITCVECGRTETVPLLTGRPPRYCSEQCLLAARARQGAARMRTMRERRGAPEV